MITYNETRLLIVYITDKRFEKYNRMKNLDKIEIFSWRKVNPNK